METLRGKAGTLQYLNLTLDGTQAHQNVCIWLEVFQENRSSSAVRSP